MERAGAGIPIRTSIPVVTALPPWHGKHELFGVPFHVSKRCAHDVYVRCVRNWVFLPWIDVSV